MANHLAGITHVVHRHATFRTQISQPSDVANELSYDLGRIAKTIFVCTKRDPRFAAIVCPVDRRADFKAVAAIVGQRVQLATDSDLVNRTDYARTGMSPLGLDPTIDVLIDERLRDYPSVLVGGGRPGVEVELAPADLIALTNAVVTAITSDA